jgi:hypothetical protein
MPTDKLQPRNRTARLAAARAAGNPVITELESGVGNCFPGLEFDARNLDRRFFPFLVVDFVDRIIVVREVAVARAEAAGASADLLAGLRQLTQPVTQWRVVALRGDFAGFGVRELTIADLRPGPNGPPDPWTAVRLLRLGADVTLTLQSPSGARVRLTGKRASYVRDDGALADMFEPGELTQSLCSPWTHDFRDCGCYYWASNHPDIVQPAVPTPAAADDPDFSTPVAWLRDDRVTSPPPAPPADRSERQGLEFRYHDINDRWQELDIVLDGREQRAPYAPGVVAGTALGPEELVPTLRYAAGVELAVMQEYLAAAYSLNRAAGSANSRLRQDVAVAHFEVLRVAQSEMRHLKAVNTLLLEEHQAAGINTAFRPALGAATAIPGGGGNRIPAGNFRALTKTAVAEFIQVEAPSKSVDALYGRILATYQAAGRDTQAASVAQIMAEGADHFWTFRVVQELLAPHPESQYLLDVRVVPATDPRLATLQQSYLTMLDHFFKGYAVGLPEGRAEITAARAGMLGRNGVEGACQDLAAQGLLPVFGVPTDPRFARVDPPA